MRRAAAAAVLAALALAAGAAGGYLAGRSRGAALPPPAAASEPGDSGPAGPTAGEPIPVVLRAPPAVEPAPAAIPAPPASADGEALRLIERAARLYRSGLHDEARPLLARAAEVAGEGTEAAFRAHLLFAYSGYVCAEDDLALEHLLKVRAPSPAREALEACLPGPFRTRYGRAASMIRGRTPNYFLETDVGFDPERPERAAFEEIAALLERARTEYMAVFNLRLDSRFLPRVLVFARRRDFEEFSRRLSPTSAGKAGYYHPVLRTVVVDGSDPLRLRITLFHEAFHQFLSEHVDAPPWLDEGLAEYFERSEPEPGSAGLRAGVIVRSSPDETTPYQIIRAAVEARATTPLRDLLALDRRSFYEAGREPLHYAQAWSFVHFLLHGHAEGHRLLGSTFAALREGKSAVEARDAAFRLDWTALEEDWAAYVRRF